MFKYILSCIILICAPVNVFAGNGQYFYVVRKCDSASAVLFRAALKPIYGNRGLLLVLANENRFNVKDLNHLKPGDKILFPGPVIDRALGSETFRIINENQIVLTDEINADKIAEEKLKQAAPVKREIAQVPQTQTQVQPSIQAQALPVSPIVEPVKPAAVIVSSETAQSRFVFMLGSGYSRIDSATNGGGAAAVILSKPLVSADLAWEQIWSDTFDSFIGLNYSAINYQESNVGQVVHGSQSPVKMNIGLVYKFNPETRISFEVGTTDEVFVPAYQVGVATIETKPLAYAKALFIKDIFHTRKLTLTGALGGSYIMGSNVGSYEIGAGREFLGYLQVSQSLKKFTFFGRAGFSEKSQNTSVTSQIRKEIRSNFGLIIPLNGDDE